MRLMHSGRVAAAAMAAVMTATVAATGTVALAQSGTNRAFCLLTGPARECSYDTFSQCEASKRGNADSCVPNNTRGYLDGAVPE